MLAVKEEIISLSYQRERNPDDPSAAVYQRNVVWNGQIGGRSLVTECGSANSKLKRQDGSPCPVAFPPSASSVTFRTGSPSPTCIAGLRCGSLCEGYFCDRSPLKQNPDFLDPRNPDSVQNPAGPNYGNWDGNKTTRKESTSPPTSLTPSQSPTTTRSYPHSVPTLGSGLFVLEIVLVMQLNAATTGDTDVTGWYYMRGTVGGIKQNLCNDPYDAVFYSPGQRWFPAAPPTMEFVNREELFAGYGGCLYIMGVGDPPGPGQIVALQAYPNQAFDCEFEEDNAIDCGLGETRYPKIRCPFPPPP